MKSRLRLLTMKYSCNYGRDSECKQINLFIYSDKIYDHIMFLPFVYNFIHLITAFFFSGEKSCNYEKLGRYSLPRAIPTLWSSY